MYCGYLQLFEDDEGLYWETRVEISSDPVRKGGLEVRRVVLEGEEKGLVMTLRPVRDMVMEVSSFLRSLWCEPLLQATGDRYITDWRGHCAGRNENERCAEVGEIRMMKSWNQSWRGRACLDEYRND